MKYKTIIQYFYFSPFGRHFSFLYLFEEFQILHFFLSEPFIKNVLLLFCKTGSFFLL